MTTLEPRSSAPITNQALQPVWWSRPFQMFQTNLREIDAGLDVERTLDAIQDHGANTWLINAGGILAFHPTDLPFQLRNPHLSLRPSGDLLGDAVQAGHARGMRVIARMDFSKLQRSIADEHPDWCFRSPSGDLQVFEGLVSACPSAPYYQERSFDVLTEVLDRYPIDGFFFNWFGFNEVDYGGTYHGVCHCRSCAGAFSSRAEDLPAGPDSPGYEEWKVFAARSVEALTARMRAHIAEHRPDAALIRGKNSDIIFHEANNAIGRELWHHATAEAVSATKSVRPDVPVLVNCVAFVDMPYRMAGEEPDHFAQYLAQAIARGANPSTYIMGPPGAVRYDGLPAAAEVTSFHARWSAIYDGLRPAARVGLVRPDRLAQLSDAHDRSVSEFRGFYSALQETHLPFDVVPLESMAEAAESGSLVRYAVLILPDVGPLADSAVAVMDRYAEEGGALIASGSSGIRNGRVRLTSLPSTSVLAVHDGFGATKSSYFLDDDEALAIFGTRRELAWKAQAIKQLKLLPQAPYGPPEKAHGHVATDEPGYTTASAGKGSGVQFAWTIGRSYRELGTTNLRRAIVKAVLAVLGGESTTGSLLPEQVEVVVARNGADLVVHLLNFSGARRKSFGPPMPVMGASLRLTAPDGAHARALVAGVDCPLRREGEELIVELPVLGLFEVVVVSDASGEASRDD